MRVGFRCRGLLGVGLVIGALVLMTVPVNVGVAAAVTPIQGTTLSGERTAAAGPSLGRLRLGYWLVQADAQVLGWGNAVNYTPQPPLTHSASIVGAARTPDGGGYWLVGSDGGIFSFGDAHFYGSTGSIRLNQPVVGMAATPTGQGYWLVGSDGGIFSFGDAHFYGSTGNIRLNQPVVGMAATPDGHGYWLVASDGGIFSFGDAHFYGSTGNIRLNQPVVGMAATPTGHGYWLVARRRRDLQFRRRPLLRFYRQHPPQPAGRGHGRHPHRSRLLAGGTRRRDLHLRRRRVRRIPGRCRVSRPHGRRAGQSAPLGTIAAHSPAAGVWEAHGANISIADDGRFALDYRTFNWCNLPGSPRGPGPCDYLAGNLIIDGGSVGGRITSTANNTAATTITWDPASAFSGQSTTMTYDSAHNALRFGPFTFCGPAGLSISYCGA